MTHGQGFGTRYLVLARGLARARGAWRAASVHSMLLGCIVAGFCGTLDASRGQHLSLDSHLAFAVSADAIRALDVVKKKSFAQNLVVSSRL